MPHTDFYRLTHTADELNQHHAEERARLMCGLIGRDRLPKPAGRVPPLSPAGPGVGYDMRTAGGNRKGMIDR